ncbi:hypothetical protein IU501_05800 [Nocardia otitidiscaviarum]|uniref:DUF6236 family protein n=1 Tax=Nocardia otitidiscaviarum TaxID=1823 RepID=UPI00189342C3|nr:DUF6236 family protein [Nocardia otitidiscaviarum]MBF6132511.1 hypothetical protein [Nocardia otitidiscaviarum]MBF6240806.1 hypothetical protein [Nocardia otitidiscaviarum]
MSQIALYYPWMRFRNENWLKLALLTWDHLARIRPRLTLDSDSDAVRRLQDETDFLHSVEPVREDLRKLASVFGDIVRADEDRLLERYAWREVVTSGRPSSRDANGPRATYPGLVWIHAGTGGPKMHLALSRLLEEQGLAITVEEAAGSYVGMHPRLARIYLTALADVVATRHRLSPATDDPRMHAAVGTVDRLYDLLVDDEATSPVFDDVQHAYIHLAVNATLRPERLKEVPLSTLIAFRERHAGQLRAFRDHVGALSKEIESVAEIEDPAVAQLHLKSVYRSTTKPQLDELRKALSAFGVDSTAGLLGLKVDLPASALAGAVGGALTGVSGFTGAGAGFAFAAVPYVADRIRLRRKAIQESPVSYLLAVDRKLAGKSLLGRMRR